MESKWVKRLAVGTAIAVGLGGSFLFGEQSGRQAVRVEVTQSQSQEPVKENMRRWKQIRRNCFNQAASQGLTHINCNDWATERLNEELGQARERITP